MYIPSSGRVHNCVTCTCSLRWRYNERDGVSNRQRLDCLLNRLFRRRSKKISKLRVTRLYGGNSPVTGEFPAQRANNMKNFQFQDVIIHRSQQWPACSGANQLIMTHPSKTDFYQLNTVNCKPHMGLSDFHSRSPQVWEWYRLYYQPTDKVALAIWKS